MKEMETERQPAAEFLILSLFCVLQVFKGATKS